MADRNVVNSNASSTSVQESTLSLKNDPIMDCKERNENTVFKSESVQVCGRKHGGNMNRGTSVSVQHYGEQQVAYVATFSP